MELRQLRYFLALARTLNFTRAAEEMHIAQPPLSRQIAHLEEELGVALVDREARPMRLTPAGELFRDHATEVLGRIERMAADTRRLGHSGQRTLRMGVEAYCLYGRFPALIRKIRADNPQLRIEVRAMRASAQAATLKSGEIDVGISHQQGSDPAIEQVVVREDPLTVAIPMDHPLASQAPSPIRLDELTEETVILLPPRRARSVRAFLAERGFQPKAVIDAGEMQVALGLVAADSGICILPSTAGRMRAEDVRYRPLAEPGATSPIILSYSREHPAELASMVLELLTQTPMPAVGSSVP
jgi:DNA-binding transcriptional LysR family regulator